MNFSTIFYAKFVEIKKYDSKINMCQENYLNGNKKIER